ncbi:PREDICTED: A4U43_C04F4810 [Prunus dulcis]|uniref:PREDICTED: A4U43_C04F4810 n=1 Tax=Prunus dulcis TaxID=3755 RepID=A0A5E4FWK9_PRUDU|nr:hypothetical protein L3X38_030300 [Prunus dulcis]VVA31720.1 PREDICTED: A4U43_C04F4810 [Prunus dulcis]
MSSYVPATGAVRRWPPTYGTFVKLNVDGVVNLPFRFRGLGVVIRDGVDDLLLTASKGMFSPKASEIYATISSLRIASQMRYRYVVFEMDAKEVILSFQNSEQSWSMEGVLVDEALLSQDFQVWLEDGPLWLSDVLANNKLFS